jgi:ABC-type cobalamin/Fe3+-siderophores transport system ATPase subunit
VATAPAVLTAQGLTVDRGGRTVIHQADLELAFGEIVAVLGPNGAGKSTLLSALAGLLPISAGVRRVNGRVAAAMQSPALAARSAKANVEAALGWWGVPRQQRQARAQAALDTMGAGHLADRRAGTLSGGEARRVHLARVLALNADVLLLDEPFAGLDSSSRADLLYDAGSALRDPRRAVLVVVHDRAEAWALADRLIVLLEGRIAAHGPPSAVLQHPPVAAVAAFLGFEGRIRQPDGTTRYLRPSHVTITSDGPVIGSVTRLVPQEDGVRCEVAVDGGRLVANAPAPGPRLHEQVRLRLDGGAVFPTDQAPRDERASSRQPG